MPLTPALATLPHPRTSFAPVRPGTLQRRELLARLDAIPGGSVITLVAPAGYGKTTLLHQLARSRGSAAYLRLDRFDDDPMRLLSGVCGAIDAVEPLPDVVVRQVAAPTTEPHAGVLSAVVGALWSRDGPLDLLLDDVHRVSGAASLDALAWLTDHLPGRMRLVLAGRVRPQIALARARLDGRLVELGFRDLAFRHEETRELAMALGQTPTAALVDGLMERTGGWPAAMYLVARSGRGDQGQGPAQALGDYLGEELLHPFDASARVWLRRAAALSVMTGPLCDAVLGEPDSLRRLRDLEHHDLFVVPQDAARTEYRFHPLLRDALLDQLAEHEPGALAALRAKAARCAASLGDHDSAVEYAVLAGDLDVLASLVTARAPALYWSGRLGTLARWLEPFDVDGVREQRAAIAVLSAWVRALEGRTQAAHRWLAIADGSPDAGPMPDGARDKGPWIAAMRALMMVDGLGKAREQARLALDGLPIGGAFRQHAVLAQMGVLVADGQLDEARRIASLAAETAEARGAAPGQAYALGVAAAISLELGETGAAEPLAAAALDVVERGGLAHYAQSAMVFAAAARCAAATGDRPSAAAHIARFDRLRPHLPGGFPLLVVLAHAQAIQARLQLPDAAGARAELRELDAALRMSPDLGWLAEAHRRTRAIVRAVPASVQGGPGLTAAELRLLTFLPTHLAMHEIADRLVLSTNTVKSQATSVYGKLGASSRRQAIEQAIRAGLLDPAVLYRPVGVPIAGSTGPDEG